MSGSVHVANRRAFKLDGASEMVDRSTALGNPFVVGRDGTRLQVVVKYRRYANEELRDNPRGSFARAYRELERRVVVRARRGEDTTLVCWCAPEACHADVLRAMLLRAMRRRKVA